MKTFIFCTSYIGENSSANNHKRYERWVRYYSDKAALFGADRLVLIDDGSSSINLKNVNIVETNALPYTLEDGPTLFHFEKNLGRPTHNDYQGWWRSFTYSMNIALKYEYEKIIHIESDFFILTTEMIQYIKDLTTGWTAFYSEFLRLPESALQIICKDQFSAFQLRYEEVKRNNFRANRIAERYLPFTHVERKFSGDRLGEFHVLDGWLEKIKIPFKLDYIGQIDPKFSVEDYKDLFDFQFRWE